MKDKEVIRLRPLSRFMFLGQWVIIREEWPISPEHVYAPHCKVSVRDRHGFGQLDAVMHQSEVLSMLAGFFGPIADKLAGRAGTRPWYHPIHEIMAEDVQETVAYQNYENRIKG